MRGWVVVLVVGAACSPPSEPVAAAAKRQSLSAQVATSTVGRHRHTATLVGTGEVLIAGGRTGGPQGATPVMTEWFNPDTGALRPAPSPLFPRTDHAAVALHSGAVLLVGGLQAPAERLEPGAAQWVRTGAHAQPTRAFPTATLLRDGRVLLAGGWNVASYFAGTELYDPATDQWTAGPTMSRARALATAAVLPDGRVLIVGGGDANGPLADCEVFDPQTNQFSSFPSLQTGRYEATLTVLDNGGLVVTGGEVGAGTQPIASAEYFDPDLRQWVSLPSMSSARALHTASLLPDGRLFVAGGYGSSLFGASVGTAEVLDPGSRTWSAPLPLEVARQMHTAVVTSRGDVALMGGLVNGQQTAIIEVHQLRTTSWHSRAALPSLATQPVVSLLDDGRVLSAGGLQAGAPTADVALFKPGTGWASAPPLQHARSGHSSTLLPSGEVLVVGGAATATAERFEPRAQAWTTTSTATARSQHSATLLADGRVLVVGGSSAGPQVELFDGTGFSTGPTTLLARSRHTATRLRDGRVWVAGGDTPSGPTATTELFSPATGTWVSGPALASSRAGHSATPLRDGRVFVAGGDAAATWQLFDPASAMLSAPQPLPAPLGDHVATLLPDGRVMLAGGSVTLFDPLTHTFTMVSGGPPAAEQAVWLLTGDVLVLGGTEAAVLEHTQGPVPTLDAVPTLREGLNSLVGAGFISGSEGSSGGHQSSPANLPVVWLRELATGVVWSLPVSRYDDQSAEVLAPRPGRGGLAVWVTTGGRHSVAQVTRAATNSSNCSTDAECATGFCTEGVCCNSRCHAACETCVGPTVGTCSPRSRGSTCRVSGGECDVAEQCDGVEVTCPQDLVLSEGTPCSVGVCDGTASCRAPMRDAGMLVDGGTVSVDAGPSPMTSPRGCGCTTAEGWGAWLLIALLAVRRAGRAHAFRPGSQ